MPCSSSWTGLQSSLKAFTSREFGSLSPHLRIKQRGAAMTRPSVQMVHCRSRPPRLHSRRCIRVATNCRSDLSPKTWTGLGRLSISAKIFQQHDVAFFVIELMVQNEFAIS